MIVREGKRIARDWVEQCASEAPGFAGAYFAGSINSLPDEAPLAVTSDIDLWIVYEGTTPPVERGKRPHEGVLVDVSCAPFEQLHSAERIVADYHVAPSFAADSIILDPSGRLTELHTAVAAEYRTTQWVRARCEHARSNVLKYIDALAEHASFPDAVLAWLFAAGVTTHILLAAGLKNPTVRRRYAALRELLDEHGRLDEYEPFLELLGCARMSRHRVELCLAELAAAFDAAAGLIKTPFAFASDISPHARGIAIDGSRELIEAGCIESPSSGSP
jgi:hypothetical protein